MEFRRSLACLAVVVAGTACGAGPTGLEGGRSSEQKAPSPNPCPRVTCDAPGTRVNFSYPYRLFTHCGVLETRFDGRAFYIAAIDPDSVTGGLNDPEDVGTMMLVSPHVAVFRSASGNLIRFVDSPPGVTGRAYPFRILVQSGGNQLNESRFAGRLWRAQGTLPGVTGPPYGNGQDRFTVVNGTMTLTGQQTAVFRSSTGTEVQFVDEGPMLCD